MSKRVKNWLLSLFIASSMIAVAFIITAGTYYLIDNFGGYGVSAVLFFLALFGASIIRMTLDD